VKGKIIFVAGAAAGYVLGARAGRKRYEQIAAAANRFWQTQPVQDVASTVGGAAKAQLGTVSDVAGGKKSQGSSDAEATAAARRAASKVDEAAASAGSGGSASSTSTSKA
jgi:hypothetical protein